MSDTPIYDFVNDYNQKSSLRFHMPGHKGNPRLGPEPADITEVAGADSLYEAGGIIADSERIAAGLFGFGHTLYSTEGASQCIKAMIYLAMHGARLQGCVSPRILAARGAHKAFIHACGLLDAVPVWLYPDGDSGSHCSCPTSPESVRTALESQEEKPFALYITAPDYLGYSPDIAGIAAVCREFGVPMLVDNAHGAYLKFLEPSRHPVDLGALMSADSAHKTLPVLTGGAYLHLSAEVPESVARHAKSALSLFGSTSPSYLTLCSLDLCNDYLSRSYPARLAAFIREVDGAKDSLCAAGWTVRESEPLKIVLDLRERAATGSSVAAELRVRNIECEYADDGFIVFMLTPDNTSEQLRRLCSALSSPPPPADCGANKSLPSTTLPFPRNRQVMSVREAMMSISETVPSPLAAGRICAAPTAACPPAIPIAVSGELINEECARLLVHYGVESIEVVIE